MEKFKDSRHEKTYEKILSEMCNCLDCYHKALAYLIALDETCSEHIHEIYDFDNHIIVLPVMTKSWQTKGSIRTLTLAFNLYTGHMDWDADNEYNCSASDIFGCSYAPYYYEAIKLRYPEYTNIT